MGTVGEAFPSAHQHCHQHRQRRRRRRRSPTTIVIKLIIIAGQTQVPFAVMSYFSYLVFGLDQCARGSANSHAAASFSMYTDCTIYMLTTYAPNKYQIPMFGSHTLYAKYIENTFTAKKKTEKNVEIDPIFGMVYAAQRC